MLNTESGDDLARFTRWVVDRSEGAAADDSKRREGAVRGRPQGTLVKPPSWSSAAVGKWLANSFARLLLLLLTSLLRAPGVRAKQRPARGSMKV